MYRSSSYLTEFFGNCGTDYANDGSTRWALVAEMLNFSAIRPHSSLNYLTPFEFKQHYPVTNRAVLQE